MILKVYSPDGAASREADFSIPTFEGDKGLQAVKEVVVAHQANARLGTHSTLRRGEVRGGGRKPWRQKGTGRARAGSVRSPLWPGGGIVFGPKPREYAKKINARVKALAFRRALYDRAVAGEIDVIERFEVSPVKTRVIGQVLGRIAPAGSLLVVDDPLTPDTRRAARNLRRVSLQEAAKLNTVDLCGHGRIVVSARAIETIIARAGGANGGHR